MTAPDRTPPDPVLGAALGRASPPADFPRQRIHERVSDTVAQRRAESRRIGIPPRSLGRWVRWVSGAAAVLAVFVGGVWVGRVTTIPDHGVVPAPTLGSEGFLLDLTTPFSLEADLWDAGLGMTVHCVRCQIVSAGSRLRWAVPAFPVIATVTPRGVAARAGLREGDRILSVEGVDVREWTGGSVLNDLPQGDFTIGYQREGQNALAHINRRIIRQATNQRGIQTVNVREQPPPGFVGRLWRALVALFN